MDDQISIKSIKDKLELIKEKQPNLYKIWKTTIYKQEMKLSKTLLDCNSMLEKVNDLNKPLSLLDIQTLIILGTSINNLNTLNRLNRLE